MTSAPTPITIPSCPSCGERMDSVTISGGHDRPRVTALRCVGCGVEDRHVVEADVAEEMEAA